MDDVANVLNGTQTHQKNGKFAKGNKLGRGNPNNKKTYELRKLWLGCYSDGDTAEVYAKLLELVRSGDVAAIKVWLEHGPGKPAQPVEVSGADGESLGLTPAVFARAASEAIGGDPDARRRFAMALLDGPDGGDG
jgi:hypothetical protein